MRLTATRLKQRNSRVQSHLALVRSIASHYASCTAEPLDDLLQVGALGLIRAAELYRKGRRVPFDAYAKSHIRGAVLHYLRDVAPLVRESRRTQERRQQLQRRQRQGLAVEEQLLALGLPPKRTDFRESDWCRLSDEPDGGSAGQPELLEALGGLETKQRVILEAVVLRGESLRSVAMRQGSSAATVHRLLHRALSNLRTQLNPAFGAATC